MAGRIEAEPPFRLSFLRREGKAFSPPHAPSPATLESRMSSSPYIPRADGKFLAWATQFVHGIQSSPYSYGLSPADGEALQRSLDEFAQAYALATNESTRTKPVIAAKNDARAALENFCRRYAALIRPNNGVSTQDLVSLGVRPANASHARRQAPATSPMINVISAGNSVHELHFNDSMAPDRKAKPFGAVCLQLFCAITEGDDVPTVDDAQFVGSMTRNRFLIVHEHKDARKTATYWGRWQSRRGDVGPWSLPRSFTIAFGGVGSGNAGGKKTVVREAETATDQSLSPVRLAA